MLKKTKNTNTPKIEIIKGFHRKVLRIYSVDNAVTHCTVLYWFCPTSCCVCNRTSFTEIAQITFHFLSQVTSRYVSNFNSVNIAVNRYDLIACISFDVSGTQSVLNTCPIYFRNGKQTHSTIFYFWTTPILVVHFIILLRLIRWMEND